MMNAFPSQASWLRRTRLLALPWLFPLSLSTASVGCGAVQGEEDSDKESKSQSDADEKSKGSDSAKKKDPSKDPSSEDTKEDSGAESTGTGDSEDSSGSGEQEPKKDETVPEEFAGEKNPFAADDEAALKAGKPLYVEHCGGCHAADGSGELPFCPDFTSETAAKWKDDWVLWKVTKGTGDMMPGADGILSREEVWQVITYLRTFSKGK